VVGLPAGRRVGGPFAGAYEQVGLGLGAPVADDRQIGGEPLGLGSRACVEAVGVQQVVDLTGHLDLAAGQDDQVVADAFELGDDVRGETRRRCRPRRRRP